MQDVDSEFFTPEDIHIKNLTPYNWLETAKIYNQDYALVSYNTLKKDNDIIVLNFSLFEVDRDNIMLKFYEIYEDAKYMHIPVEVINVPMDQRRLDMTISFDLQANWFTIDYNDRIIPVLQYLYSVSSVPYLVVIRPDGAMVSDTGIADLEEYGKNALMVWLSNAAKGELTRYTKKQKDRGEWKYCSLGRSTQNLAQLYQRKSSKGLSRLSSFSTC